MITWDYSAYPDSLMEPSSWYTTGDHTILLTPNTCVVNFTYMPATQEVQGGTINQNRQERHVTPPPAMGYHLWQWTPSSGRYEAPFYWCTATALVSRGPVVYSSLSGRSHMSNHLLASWIQLIWLIWNMLGSIVLARYRHLCTDLWNGT